MNEENTSLVENLTSQEYPIGNKVAVYVDLENIFYSTSNYYAEKLDWDYLRELCASRGELISVQVFGDWSKPEFQEELTYVQRAGFMPMITPSSGKGKSSVDCHLTVAALKFVYQKLIYRSKVDTFLIASGDRDYIPLVAEIKRLGAQVVILALPDTLAADLEKIVDDVIIYQPRNEEGRERGSQVGEEGEGGSDEPDKDIDKVAVVYRELYQLSRQTTDGWVDYTNVKSTIRQNLIDKHKMYIEERELEQLIEDSTRFEKTHPNGMLFVRTARPNPHSEYKAKVVESRPARSGVFDGVIFSLKDGYGFITPDEDGDNIFFHNSGAGAGTNFYELNPGDKVSYKEKMTPRGVNAFEVTKVD